MDRFRFVMSLRTREIGPASRIGGGVSRGPEQPCTLGIGTPPATTVGMAHPDERNSPEEREAARLDAAIEGATPGHGNSFGIRDRVTETAIGSGGAAGSGGGGAGASGSGSGAGGGGLGIQSTSAGPGEQPDDPSAETGGPRGAGTATSRSSGGRTGPDYSEVRDPEEAIRQSTSRPLADRERARGEENNG
jgi:hypothetical protein